LAIVLVLVVVLVLDSGEFEDEDEDEDEDEKLRPPCCARAKNADNLLMFFTGHSMMKSSSSSSSSCSTSICEDALCLRVWNLLVARPWTRPIERPLYWYRLGTVMATKNTKGHETERSFL